MKTTRSLVGLAAIGLLAAVGAPGQGPDDFSGGAEDPAAILKQIEPALRAKDRGKMAALASRLRGQAGAGEAASRLARALEDNDPSVRSAAAKGLRGLGRAATAQTQALIRRLEKDESPDVRLEAARCLGSIGRPAKAALPALFEAGLDADDPDLPEVANEALRLIGDGLQELLIDRLGSDRVETRRSAARQLGRVAWATDVGAALSRALRDADAEVRALAAEDLALHDRAADTAVPE